MLAVYPPVWAGDRGAALRTVVLTEAIATTLGAELLIWGDDRGCLRHPYYPDHERLTADEAGPGAALAPVRAALPGPVRRRHRHQLVRDRRRERRGRRSAGRQPAASGGVGRRASGPALPEPDGGALYARVVRHEGCIAVSVLDLTGSPAGSWQAPTGPGQLPAGHGDGPAGGAGRWTAAAAVIGRDGDRFAPVADAAAPRPERASQSRSSFRAGGWSVLRLTRR